MTDNGKEQAHVKEAIKDQMLVSGDLATQRGRGYKSPFKGRPSSTLPLQTFLTVNANLCSLGNIPVWGNPVAGHLGF